MQMNVKSAIAVLFLLFSTASAENITLLNVSYDPTREFYREFNEAFAKHYKSETGHTVTIKQSHGGAGKQARAVIDGLEADVVTLALAYDIDEIAAHTDLLSPEWQSRLPNHSAPYTSTIVFLVRKGNPKNIKDWSDLVQGDVKIITPNPKTSGGARLNYLAAWGFILQRELGDISKVHDPAYADAVSSAHNKAFDFMKELFKRVPVLDSGARGSTTTFAQREIGDVLLTWENEALLALDQLGRDKFDIIYPSISILAEPPVTMIDKNVNKRGTRVAAEAYLHYLYSPIGQQLAAKHYYRPFLPEHAAASDLARFTSLPRFSVAEAFGSWKEAQAKHFSDGGYFDQLFAK